MSPITFQIPFGPPLAGLGMGKSCSLQSSLPIIAGHFGIENGERLLNRLQETVSGLLQRPEVTTYLGANHVRNLTSFLDLNEEGDDFQIDQGTIHAFGALHSLHQQYESLFISPSGPVSDAVRESVLRQLRLTGPLVDNDSVIARMMALRPAGAPQQAVSLTMSAGEGSRIVGEKVGGANLASSGPERASSQPPLEERRENKERIAEWVASKGGRPEQAIQRVLIVNNGMSATCLIKGIRSLSDRIAIDQGLNPADHRLIDVVGMASKSDLESAAHYLGEVDRLVRVPVEKAGDVFLNYDQIFKVAREEGIDTLVLGWGFVAEKADFVKMAVERGFNVVAPPHTAMSQLGGKISSKVLAEDANVPVLPWTGGAVDRVEEAVEFARQHEYCVAIKADAGGGGKGIRLVEGRGDSEIDYRIWRDPIGGDVPSRAQQRVDLLRSVGGMLPGVSTTEEFIALDERDQARWIQILRLAAIIRKRREWISKEQDEGIPEPLSDIEAATATIRDADPEALREIVEIYIVENHVANSYQSASDEGKISFKDPTVFMEILAPADARHIEIQVDADQHGNARALLERDCSPQIARQKVFEEGPAIFVSDEIRREMREAAVRVAKKSGYTNVGTCEFLYSPSRAKFWFMEMNTRLQVEHPVTELLIDRSLVEIQLERAMGVPLNEQEIGEFSNRFDMGRHVIAARINAKDPNNGFAPSPGKITELRLPETPNVRVYFSLDEGSTVSTSSDSQIGHVFAWGETRDLAIATLRRALESMVVEGEGIKTTIEFSIDVLSNPAFQSGENLTIGWLNQIADKYSERALPVSGPVALAAAAIYRFEALFSQDRVQFQSDLSGGRSLNRDLIVNSRSFELPFAGHNYQVTIRRLDAHSYAVDLEGVPVEVEVVRRDSSNILTLGGRTHEVTVTGRDQLRVQVDGRAFEGATHDPTKIRSFTQGSAWKVLVQEGQRVRPGDELIILESMKMEFPVEAEIAGTIRKIHVGEKDAVKTDQALVEIEPEGEAPAAEKRQEIIRFEADAHSVIHNPERLAEYIGRFPVETLHDVLVRILNGASYPTFSPEGQKKFVTVEGVILDRYRSEAEELRERFRFVSSEALADFVRDGIVPEANGEERETLLLVSSTLARLREVVDLFVRDEQHFAQTGNERAAYKAAGDCGFDLALSHFQLEAKTRIVLQALELAKFLPYQAPLPSEHFAKRSLVEALEPIEQFRTEAYRVVRNRALDLIEYARPRRPEYPFSTEEKIVQAAALPLFSPRRNAFTEELVSEPLLSDNKLLELLDHQAYEVRSLAGYILLRRTHKRHKLLGDTYQLRRTERLDQEYATWQFQDGQTNALRVGVAVSVSLGRGPLTRVLPRAAGWLNEERKKLDPARGPENDTLEVIVSPNGLDDYEDSEDFLRSAREMLRMSFPSDPPKRVTFAICGGEGKPTEHYTFRPMAGGGFAEDMRFRGLDPYQANLLEMQRWSGFDLTKLPTDDRPVHIWSVRRSEWKEVQGERKEEIDERLTVRTLVLDADIRPSPEGLSLPNFAESYQRTVQVLRRQLDRYEPKARPPLNHLFFNILPVIHADFDEARELVEATVKRHHDEHHLSSLVKVEVLAKVRDKTSQHGYRDVIFVIDLSGSIHLARGYVVVRKGDQIYRVHWNRFFAAGRNLDRIGPDELQPMGVPYRPKTELEKLRSARYASGNVYVYDRPKLFRNDVERLWREAGLDSPADVFSSIELVLDDGVLQEVEREPMRNDRSMVAWRMKVHLPGEDQPREVIILSSDYTYEYGSVSPKEGEFYDAVVGLAEREGLPFGQILEGTGARIGLDPSVALPYKQNGVDIPAPLQFDPATGQIYLTEEGFNQSPRILEPGVEAKKIGDIVEGEWIELTLKEGEPPQRVFRVDTIIGGIRGLNTENLSQGSGLMAGRLERAYESIPTMTIVADTMVGILTYLARIGRRVIQVESKPQLLTGNRTLNAMYKRAVFASNREIGDESVMLPNGVAQYGAKNEPDAVRQFIQWLGYLPRRRGEEAPTISGVELNDRDVGSLLLGDGIGTEGIILDRQGKVQAYDPRLLINALFDRDSFQESAQQWGRVVVAGRTRIGGVPVGVIAFDPRTQTLVVPADPVDRDHRERNVPQAGNVWHPDAAFKTAQMLMDFEHEGIEKVILANVKGFPGGSFDMGPGSITKFGAMIVTAMTRAGQGRRLLKPVIVVVPPYGEIRGGAQVVVDAYLNRESVVFLMDEKGQMSVLPREGMHEVPVVSKNVRQDKRFDPKTTRAFWDAVIDAHQTPRRALRMGSVESLVETPNLRRDIYRALMAKRREVAEMEQMLAAQAQLRAIATFIGLHVTESPDGGLIVGGEGVFGDDGLEARFDDLLSRAKAQRG